MSVPDFLDSNVLVYAYDASDPEKQRVAQQLLQAAVAGAGVVSTQVIAEFAAVLLHKISPAASPESVTAILDAIGPIQLIEPDGEIVRRAVEVHAKYRLHFYDGMIVAAAEKAGCNRIWSEDLNPGQSYFGVKVVNPFS